MLLTWMSASGLWSGLGWAAPADLPPPDLKSLRIEYRRSLLTALLPEKKTDHEQLLALEHALAAKGDYAGAIRARDARRAIGQEITAMEHEIPALAAQAQAMRTGSLPDRFVFPAKEAVTQALTLDAKTGALMGWDGAKSSAQWKLPDIPPGGYEVLINYCCAESLEVTLKEAFYHLTGALPPTPAAKPQELNLGTLRVKDGQTNLRLELAKAGNSAELRILSVTLAPANR